MFIDDSEISCGVKQLTEIGTDPTDEAYQAAMREFHGAILVASVPVKWKKAIKFLKRKGFKQAHRAIKNPNSGNKIVLLSRNYSAKDRRKIVGPTCLDCGDSIPKGRRVCDNGYCTIL